MTRTLRCAGLLLGAVFLANAASAEPAAVSAPNAAEAPRRDAAKAKYEQGVEAYRAEHYVDAVRLFLDADAIAPSAALSYNIARAYEKLSDDAQTLRWYRNYLRLSPNAPNAAEVQKYVRDLSGALAKKGIQQLTVMSTPNGATVAIDGNPLGVTPLTVELRPGKHTALLSYRGYTDAQTEFDLPAQHPLDLPVNLSLAPPPAEGGRRFGVVPWVTLGAAAVCLGTAVGFEMSRRSAESSAENQSVQLDYEREIERMNSRQTTARVFLGVGSALAVTGAALLVFNTRVTPESKAVVAGIPGGATLAWQRSF